MTATAYQRPPTVDPNQSRFDPNAYDFNPQAYDFRGPQAVNAADYRIDPRGNQYTPGQVLNAGDYRYQPQETLDPSQYQYTPTESRSLGQFNFKPPTLTDDPGYNFRLRQGQEALDASAASRGGLGSGAQLKALQNFGQEIGSQEYGAAYGRSWQQQQEQYERSKLANMTEEQRRQYADATNYGRDMTANVQQEERGRYANQADYERNLRMNQEQEARAQYGDTTNYGRGLAATQWNFGAAPQCAARRLDTAAARKRDALRQGRRLE